MKSEITKSNISIPLPTVLYVGLVDLLRTQKVRRDPAAVMATVIGNWIASQAAPHGVEPSHAAEASADWNNDWIMFEAPPASNGVARSTPFRRRGRARNSDWCIGCGCPSEDLLAE